MAIILYYCTGKPKMTEQSEHNKKVFTCETLKANMLV